MLCTLSNTILLERVWRRYCRECTGFCSEQRVPTEHQNNIVGFWHHTEEPFSKFVHTYANHPLKYVLHADEQWNLPIVLNRFSLSSRFAVNKYSVSIIIRIWYTYKGILFLEMHQSQAQLTCPILVLHI